MKKAIIILLLISIIASVIEIVIVANRIQDSQLEDLKQMRIQMEQIEKDQKKNEEELKLLETKIVEEMKKVDFGKASWYDYDLAGIGDYSKSHRTCASRKYKRGTYLSVSYEGKSVVCLVNDYGPDGSIHPDRIIDLSSFAYQQLSSLDTGIINVSVRELK